MRIAVLSLLAILPLLHAAPLPAQTRTVHALSLIDTPKYPADFKQLDHVNPDAPKGGTVRLGAFGGFDNLNPFVAKGDSATGLGFIYETLMTTPADELSTEYGLIAETVEVPDDLTWVVFNLRGEAKWADGQPITADDVAYSFDMIKTKGPPMYQFYYANVAKAEVLGRAKVKFHFTGPKNRELPQIMGQLPVIQKAQWEKREFDKVSLEPWTGSGPYRIKEFEANRFISYERRADWWGKDLPINRGRYNFDTIRYDFYRDQTILREAFKSGQYDYRSENSAREWATFYVFPAVEQGLVKKETIPHERPGSMLGFVMNMRREKFQDVRVRRALLLAWDFEWVNKNLAHSAYFRPASFFDNSVFAATGEPSAAELKLLEPFRAQLPKEVFGPAYKPPVSDGSGNDRKNLREAARLLKEAGWSVKDNVLRNAKGEALTVDFLMVEPTHERMGAPWAQNLKQLGIQFSMRAVDSAQYIERIRRFDYDVIYSGWGQSNSPGNEQRDYWTSAAADRPSSRNLAGLKNPAVDALVDALIAAQNREELIPAARALDRVLSWQQFVVPSFGLNADRIAYWDKFGRPAKTARYGNDFMAWWVDPAKEARLKERRP